jgi:hypothetical protein
MLILLTGKICTTILSPCFHHSTHHTLSSTFRKDVYHTLAGFKMILKMYTSYTETKHCNFSTTSTLRKTWFWKWRIETEMSLYAYQLYLRSQRVVCNREWPHLISECSRYSSSVTLWINKVSFKNIF